MIYHYLKQEMKSLKVLFLFYKMQNEKYNNGVKNENTK